MGSPIVLIETYWNVNTDCPWLVVKLSPVLIETYWNVNLEKCIVNCKMGGVLIETYWNVNGVEWSERVFKSLY